MTGLFDTMKQYSKEHADWLRTFTHDVTDNDVAFDWGVTGSTGAWFVLIREPQHTDADIERAKRFLHIHRDVVSIHVERMVE